MPDVIIYGNLRGPQELSDRLRTAYWRTGEQHKLSYNLWLCWLLESALEMVLRELLEAGTITPEQYDELSGREAQSA